MPFLFLLLVLLIVFHSYWLYYLLLLLLLACLLCFIGLVMHKVTYAYRWRTLNRLSWLEKQYLNAWMRNNSLACQQFMPVPVLKSLVHKGVFIHENGVYRVHQNYKALAARLVADTSKTPPL